MSSPSLSRVQDGGQGDLWAPLREAPLGVWSSGVPGWPLTQFLEGSQSELTVKSWMSFEGLASSRLFEFLVGAAGSAHGGLPVLSQPHPLRFLFEKIKANTIEGASHPSGNRDPTYSP